MGQYQCHNFLFLDSPLQMPDVYAWDAGYKIGHSACEKDLGYLVAHEVNMNQQYVKFQFYHMENSPTAFSIVHSPLCLQFPILGNTVHCKRNSKKQFQRRTMKINMGLEIKTNGERADVMDLKVICWMTCLNIKKISQGYIRETT